MTLSPEWIGLLLWVLGLFMGGGAAMVYGRRGLAEARNRSELVRTQYEAPVMRSSCAVCVKGSTRPEMP